MSFIFDFYTLYVGSENESHVTNVFLKGKVTCVCNAVYSIMWDVLLHYSLVLFQKCLGYSYRMITKHAIQPTKIIAPM